MLLFKECGWWIQRARLDNSLDYLFDAIILVAVFYCLKPWVLCKLIWNDFYVSLSEMVGFVLVETMFHACETKHSFPLEGSKI